MKPFDLLLGSHITAASSSLALGPVAMLARKKRGLHTRVGTLYVALMTYVCMTAVIISILRWEEDKLYLPVAIISFLILLTGYTAVRRKKPGWVNIHRNSMIGSYLALWIAVFVLSAIKLNWVRL